MLILKDSEYHFGNDKIAEVIVIGHAVIMRTKNKQEVGCMDLSDINACYKLANHIGVLSFVDYLFQTILPNSENWGENEQDYEYGLNSEDNHIRRLVAKNGKYRSQLSCDKDYLVRTEVVQSLVKERVSKNEVDDKEWFDDLNKSEWLYRLLSDENKWVRYSLIELGLEYHLEILTGDRDAFISRKAIARTSVNQLKMLVSSENPVIRQQAIANPLITHEQLVMLEKDRNDDVLAALAMQGYTSEGLMSSPIRKIRFNQASYGDFDKIGRLAYDKDATIRERIAFRGLAHDVLYKDPDPCVRKTVALYANRTIIERMSHAIGEDEIILNIIRERMRFNDKTRIKKYL